MYLQIYQAPNAEIHINSYSTSHNWCTAILLNRIITVQWEGMGDVGSTRYEPALLPPCPTIKVLCYSNCQRSTHSHNQYDAFLWVKGNQNIAVFGSSTTWPEVLTAPSSTRLGFELMTSRSWQYISYHWEACSNHLAISDLKMKCTATLSWRSEVISNAWALR